MKVFTVEVYGYDSLLSKEEIEIFDVKALNELNLKDAKMDCVIVAVAHGEFKQMKLEALARITSNKPVLVDVKGMLDEKEAKSKGFYYKTL